MQPLYEMTLSRPWHWGIAIVSAPGASVPGSLGDSLVTAVGNTLVIKVRYAQDIGVERFEGDWDWATATIRVRSLIGFDDSLESPVYEGGLNVPDGRLSIGDADSDVVISDLDQETRVRVYVVPAPSGATDVQIDLAAQQ